MSRAWMPMYWGDYLADTQHLTPIQHGAYLLLIAHYWQHGGLPTDHATLKRIIGLHSVDGENSWRSICLAIAPFFDENWRHKRIDHELEKYNIISEKRAIAGRKGGEFNRGKTNLDRWSIKAIAKQRDHQSPKKDITSTEYVPRETSKRLAEETRKQATDKAIERIRQAKTQRGSA